MKIRKGSIIMVKGGEMGWCLGRVKGFGVSIPFQVAVVDILDTELQTDSWVLKEGKFACVNEDSITMIEY